MPIASVEADVIGKIIQTGVLGALLVGSCFVIWYLLKTQLQARIDDQKANQAQIVDLTRQAVAAVTSSTAAMTAQKEALDELRDTFKEFMNQRRP